MLDNPQETKRRLVEWIKDYFRQNGPECTAVIGISGGKDSSICAALCLEALGPERRAARHRGFPFFSQGLGSQGH